MDQLKKDIKKPIMKDEESDIMYAGGDKDGDVGLDDLMTKK